MQVAAKWRAGVGYQGKGQMKGWGQGTGMLQGAEEQSNSWGPCEQGGGAIRLGNRHGAQQGVCTTLWAKQEFSAI